MKLSLILLFLFVVSFMSAQNLVPNPSFEEYSNCPQAECGIGLATGWYSAGYTPDYFNACDLSGVTNFGVPQNCVGYQYAANGNAYVSIGTWGGGCENMWVVG